MRPASSERPASARSNQSGTRQRLQYPTTRRVYPVENGNNNLDIDSKINSSPITATQAKPIIEDKPDMTDTQLDLLATTPLKHLVSKKVNSAPVRVQIRCIFLRVGDIDTLNERYYVEILLEVSWEEPSFKGLQKRPFDPAVHWTPELEVMNGIGNINDDITYSVRYDTQGTATVTEHHKLKGTLWERMELEHFPVDIQALSLSITTSRTNTEMIFVKNIRKPSGVNRRIFSDEQEWYLFEHVDIKVSEQIDEYLDGGHNHPVVICYCHAARKYGYFIWNVYFLIFLITSASFSTFPIPLTNIHGRVQIACTLLLTSITFRWLSNKALPTISYLTAVDIYATGNIFSLCLLNIYHGVIGYVHYYQSTNAHISIAILVPSINTIDRWALAVFTILFFVYQIGTLIWMYLVPLKKRRMMFEKENHDRLEIASRFIDAKETFIDVLRGTRSANEMKNISRTASVDH